ncbi:MAG: cytidine deaminase [Defluviitaleaceae bacterium]|nr:cytidine deaminase [Defluviitaleaceae bacterium]
MSIEQKMLDMAVELVNKRFPKGWGGAGVVRTEDDSYFTSIYLDNIIDKMNTTLNVCIETGAMIEAYKHDKRVTHILCVSRADENEECEILTSCGVCQERLRFWGTDVMCAVTTPDNSLKFVPLGELQPYHWSTAKAFGTIENFDYHKGS